jgi:hypothetical protein
MSTYTSIASKAPTGSVAPCAAEVPTVVIKGKNYNDVQAPSSTNRGADDEQNTQHEPMKTEQP